jgi:cyclopropane fatty-acyl-phospholipid synthase-like methyltransferase
VVATSVRRVAQRPVDRAQRTAYWEHVHRDKDVDAVSWWQPVPEASLRLIDAAGVGPADPIVDVGAGWSTLADHLVARGHQALTVVDVSATALSTTRERLGTAAADVRFEVADVLDLSLPTPAALWHDRAVFHFLTEADERAAYLTSLARCLRPDGSVVVATFAPDGPETCSGLPVVRYSPEQLAAEFPGFELVTATRDDHLTPWGATQPFTAVLLARR